MFKIVSIGAGRLAHQLMPALERAGCSVIEIYNRSYAGAASLSLKLASPKIQTDITQISKHADLYFILLKDDVIEEVTKHLAYLENPHVIFVHSSGILPIDIIPFKRRGIFYPLQSFSNSHTVDWQNTPLLITSESASIGQVLTSLARSISSMVYEVTEEDKAIIHLSAVFANNFTNHMLTIANEICKQHDLSCDILKPIIHDTFIKAIEDGPYTSQTGPAVRGDQRTINKHLNILKGDATLTAVYEAISKSIIETRDKEEKN